MNADETMLMRRLFGARSQNGWRDEPVDNERLIEAYNIAKWGPTSMNTQPMRLIFLRSLAAKERLKPALAPTNVDKVMTAPVVAIIAHDLQFYTQLPKVFPHRPDAQQIFASNPIASDATAIRNGTLQAAYFMLAIRSVGLDIGPMSGFNVEKVDAEFFADSSWRVNFICGIGVGEPAKIFERLPRLDFQDVSEIL